MDGHIICIISWDSGILKYFYFWIIKYIGSILSYAWLLHSSRVIHVLTNFLGKNQLAYFFFLISYTIPPHGSYVIFFLQKTFCNWELLCVPILYKHNEYNVQTDVSYRLDPEILRHWIHNYISYVWKWRAIPSFVKKSNVNIKI